MSRKNIAFLLVVFLLLVTAMASCGSPKPIPTLEEIPSPGSEKPAITTPETEPAASTTSEPRFVITQTATPAFTPVTITPTTVSPTQITPARDLVGTWRGNGVSYWLDGDDGTRVARTTWDVTLIITQQQGNTVQGTLTMTNVQQENLTPQDIPRDSYGPDAITNGWVSSSSLYFDVDEWHWTFSFTTDLMSGYYTAPGPGTPCDGKSFTLTRQR